MFLRSSLSSSSSSLRIITSFSYYFHSSTFIRTCSVFSNSNNNSQILSSSSCLSQSQRTFMFWRANVERELYGTPSKALATKKRRRLQKSLTQIIRDGQLMRLLKESLLPEWNKWWKEVQPWDRRHEFFHNDYVIIHDFASNEEIKKWTVRTDLDEGVGESTAELVPSGHGSVLFRGNISSKMVNQNTLYNQSGFAIMFSERLRGTFLMPAHQKGWTNFTHILLRIRGDGRFYEIRFHTPDHDHHHWSDMYSMILYTRGGPYWSTAKIPFAQFFRNNMGRISDKQYAFQPLTCTQMSISVIDAADGPFELEIGEISLLRDLRYTYDKFAYEQYTLPPYTTV
ncbi:unnamed protein product [Rotaria sp. Silwood1]|nr:unnamed protein product [Rotaria sp. Silwood1]CAF0962283.1 unnamed protein product [Rotaria sp. Silwood1]CAF4615098.1 unnamed protein product [Rotaria sp. Silwood1]CAF4623330.1 unnamed protein product [Rotaria sp. Silwood1]CAF4656851.1 unnamed protein product [Rotaria sp. Silwood1]